MSEKKYKYISPGVFFKEINSSQVPTDFDEVGPVVIGRAERGPAMRPVKVNSFSEFVEYFGNPTPGSDFVDVWRDNVILGPSYGALAAQASLANKNALTFVRLLGYQHPEASDSNGGKAGWSVGSVATTRTGGAYGLFVFPSSTLGISGADIVTGTLAAVWYLQTGSIALSGTAYEDNGTGMGYTGTAGFLLSNTDKEFRVLVKNENNVVQEDVRFNFTPTNERFVRKVFNVNPTKLNSSLYSATKTYFLGETFEDFINNSDDMIALRNASKWVGVILALKNNSTSDALESRRIEAQNARTGWFFSQDFGQYSTFEVDNTQKLFRIHALDSGEWNQGNIKVSIRNIKVSTNELDRYGTFDVLVRRIDDSDSNIVVVEQFNACTLNPNSENYISKKIGDKYVVWSSTDLRNIEYGEFDNLSKFIRVEISDEVALGSCAPEALPFGVYGPLKFRDASFSSGSIGMVGSKFAEYTNAKTSFPGAFLLGSSSIADNIPGTYATTGSVHFSFTGSNATIKTASILFPYPRLRVSTLTGTLGNAKNAFFGVFTDDNSDKFSRAVRDLVRVMPSGVDSFIPSTTEGTDYTWKFTLDDIKFVAGSTTDVQWSSGSRFGGTSITAQGTYNSVLTGGFNSFTTLLAGGFDGFNVKEIEPLRNSGMSGATEKTSYVYNSINRAIEILQYPEDVEFNLAAVPGVNIPGLTRRLIEVCDVRGDALAVIDLENDFIARSESTDVITSRRPNVKNAIASLKSRVLNSTYGCTYFPWVQGRDILSNNIMYIPPSAIMLGVFAFNDKVGYAHNAPAGFARGALSSGCGGIPVIGVSLKLLSKDRDDLYQSNINPIAIVENEIVVMGQKTLQVQKTALDRIGVRRGILEIKKKFSRIATRLIFEQNVSDTWNKFLNQAEPILRDIKSKLGLEDYKLVLDASTTTADLRDRNIIYGKVFLKPAHAAEYFALDFNITNSGANFADL